MSLVGLRRELEARGWECLVMNLNENRRVVSPEYIDVQNGFDYFAKVSRSGWRGCAVHTRVTAESKKGYLLALVALALARLARRPALLTYGGGHHQLYLPAPAGSFRYLAYSLLFRLPQRIYCNNEAVRQVLLTTGIPSDRVVAIPHFSTHYVDSPPVTLPADVENFFQQYPRVFFSYVCFRKEFALEFLAEAIRRFRTSYPNTGFLLVGPWEREMGPMKDFVKKERLGEGVFVLPSVRHEEFLTLLGRSQAYIRTPISDGVCSSVLEAMKLKVPVLAADNQTRPPGTVLWRSGDIDSLLTVMEEAVQSHEALVAKIPEIIVEDNIKKLADSIEEVCLAWGNSSSSSRTRVLDRV